MGMTDSSAQRELHETGGTLHRTGNVNAVILYSARARKLAVGGKNALVFYLGNRNYRAKDDNSREKNYCRWRVQIMFGSIFRPKDLSLTMPYFS